MKNINKTFILVLCSIIIPQIIHAQFFNRHSIAIESREIILSEKDSTVRFNVLIDSREIKMQDDLVYYWFYADQIKHNKGGYSGSLLHNGYEQFDNRNNLVVKGNFTHGLKDGEWKSWYPNGKLKSHENWDEGRKNGMQRLFDEEGNLTSKTHYANGLLHGENIFYMKNDTIIHNYRRGEVVEKSGSLIRLFGDRKSNEKEE